MSQLQQENEDKAEEQLIECVLTSINNIQKKHGGQYIENIVAQCGSEHGWDRPKTVIELKKAVERQVVREVHSKGETSYRTVKLSQNFHVNEKGGDEILQNIDDGGKRTVMKENISGSAPRKDAKLEYDIESKDTQNRVHPSPWWHIFC